MLRRIMGGLGCAAALCSAAVQAQPRLPAPPPRQSPIDSLTPATPPELSPRLQPPPPEAIRGPGEGREIAISRLTIAGNEALDEARLRPLVADLVGQAVPLSRVEEGRLAILRAYRLAGYPFSSVAAGLSPSPDGVELRYAVTEGFIGEVRLEGDIGPAGTQVLRFLEPLVAERPLRGAAVERALLLASDIPGVTVRGVLRPLPGEPGALQLVAQLTRRWYSGFFNTDNRAYQLTGPVQALLVAGSNSFTSVGERIEVSLYGAEGGTQNFIQVSGEMFIGASGLRVRAYAGGGRATPGSTLAQIGYVGDTRLAGVIASYPIVRSRPFNLTVGLQGDLFESTVETGSDGNATRLSRDSTRVGRLGFDASLLEDWVSFLPPASNQASLRFHRGLNDLGLGGSTPLDQEVSRQGSNFNFRKVTGEYQRNQPLFSPYEGSSVNFQVFVSGQWSDTVLPNSEKFYFGGNRLGRGFYSGQVTGDSAAGYALELQWDNRNELSDPVTGAFTLASQLYLFRDYGRTFERNSDFNRRVSSFGGGVRVFVNDSVELGLEAVQRITRQVDGPNSAPLAEDAGYFRVLVRF